MIIEVRVKLRWEPPEVGEIHEAFMEEIDGVVDTLEGDEGSYSLSSLDSVNDVDISGDMPEAVEVVFELAFRPHGVEG